MKMFSASYCDDDDGYEPMGMAIGSAMKEDLRREWEEEEKLTGMAISPAMKEDIRKENEQNK